MVERSRDLRDRAFFALLVFVGAGALASGLYSLLLVGDGSAPIIFTTAFGASTLLVAWLFLLPEVMPRLVNGADPRPALLHQIEPAPEPLHEDSSLRASLATELPAPPRAATPPRPASPVSAAVSAAPPEPTPRARERPTPPPEPAPPRTPASEVLKELDEIYDELQPTEETPETPPTSERRRRGLGGPSTG